MAKVPECLSDRFLADTTIFGTATEVRDQVEAWFDADQQHTRKDVWLAERYADLGVEAPPSQQSPDSIARTTNLEDLERLAEASFQDPKRMQQVAERMIELADQDRRGWLLKARASLAADEPEAAAEVIEEAIAHLTHPPSELWLLRSTIEYDPAETSEDPEAETAVLLRAISILDERMERQPPLSWSDPIHARLETL